MEPRLRALVSSFEPISNRLNAADHRLLAHGAPGGFAVRLCRAQVVVMGRFWTAAGEATLESLVNSTRRSHEQYTLLLRRAGRSGPASIPHYRLYGL